MNLLLVSLLLNRTVYVVCFQIITVGIAKMCCSEYLQCVGYKYVPTFRGDLIRTYGSRSIRVVEIYIVQEGGKYFGRSSYWWSLSLQRYCVIDTYRPRIHFGSHLILVQSP